MPDSAVRVALRAIALAIAITAALDPAITTVRRDRPIVSVSAIDPAADSALALRVATLLRADARVIAARFDAADATVLVGDGAPNVASGMRAFVVRDDTRPRVTIESLRAPQVASVNANRRVDVTVHTIGVRGRAIEVLLRSGDVAIDRVRVAVANDDTLSRVQLSFVPTIAGSARLRIEASIVDTGSSWRASPERDVTVADNLHAYADALISVVDRPLSILVYDPRPSWMSTFVRRALERDRQFVITSRVVTSRNISTAAGTPPARLDNLAAIERFDAIVVGAPEALTDRDVTGLDAFLRRRGGSVVLLLDQRAGGAYDRLTGVREWRYQNNGTAQSIRVGASTELQLRAAELLWPIVLPDAATAVAVTSLAPVATGTSRDAATRKSTSDVGPTPILWSKAVGAGRLIVSGALDAWRFRDSASSHFDRGWQVVIGEAAGSALAPVTATLQRQLLTPGETADLSVVVRDAALQPFTSQSIRTTVSAVLESGAADSIERTPIQLWPAGPVGSLSATLRAPLKVGSARIIVTADGHRAEVPLIVDSIVSTPIAAQSAYAGAFAASHGGRVIPASQLSTLNTEIARSLDAAPRRERWHPMHSVWWLLPFALALSGEWLLRRRRGRA